MVVAGTSAYAKVAAKTGTRSIALCVLGSLSVRCYEETEDFRFFLQKLDTEKEPVRAALKGEAVLIKKENASQSESAFGAG